MPRKILTYSSESDLIVLEFTVHEGVFYFEKEFSEYNGAKSFPLFSSILLKAIILASLTHKITGLTSTQDNCLNVAVD